MDRRDCTGRLPSRSAQTTAAYEGRYHQLYGQAVRERIGASDVAGVVEWFCDQHGRWAQSTIRQYRATLMQRVEWENLHADARDWLEGRLRKGPEPKRKGPRETSARKRKSLPREEFKRIALVTSQSEHPDDRLLTGLLSFGVVLCLRPGEYHSARLSDSTLIVQNAKASNGRANGLERQIDISGLREVTISELRTFLELLRKAAQAAGSIKRLHNRLAARLARRCKRVGIRRVSLYTLRHVGLATAKNSMSPVEVAAAAGHASVRTAVTSYAKKRFGWKIKWVCRPLPVSIAAVGGINKTFRPRQYPTPVEYFAATEDAFLPDWVPSPGWDLPEPDIDDDPDRDGFAPRFF